MQCSRTRLDDRPWQPRSRSSRRRHSTRSRTLTAPAGCRCRPSCGASSTRRSGARSVTRLSRPPAERSPSLPTRPCPPTSGPSSARCSLPFSWRTPRTTRARPRRPGTRPRPRSSRSAFQSSRARSSSTPATGSPTSTSRSWQHSASSIRAPTSPSSEVGSSCRCWSWACCSPGSGVSGRPTGTGTTRSSWSGSCSSSPRSPSS